MAKTNEDRRISDAEIKKNFEFAGTIKKLQHELEVLKRQSDENNVASFMEVDTLRRELKKKETKVLDLQKELKATKIAKTELEARLEDKIEKEVCLQEENENLKRIINEEKEPIDEMRKKLVGDMKSHFGKFADCFLPTNDKIESREGSLGSGSNRQNPPTLTGVWLELQNALESATRTLESTKLGPAEHIVPQPTDRSPPPSGSNQHEPTPLTSMNPGAQNLAVTAAAATSMANMSMAEAAVVVQAAQQNMNHTHAMSAAMGHAAHKYSNPQHQALAKGGGGGNGYSASFPRPFESTEPRNLESTEGSSGSGSKQQNSPTLTGVCLELQKTLDGLDLNRGSPEAGSPQQMGGGGNGYSASAARPFESTEPRNIGPSLGLNGPAEPTVVQPTVSQHTGFQPKFFQPKYKKFPQPTGRSPPQITFPLGNPKIAIGQKDGIVTQELYLGAPELSISYALKTNKPKNHLKEEHNLIPEDLNDDQVKI